MVIFGEDKNDMNLENLQYQLKQLQKRGEQVTAKAESLSESTNEEMSEYGVKELEEYTDRIKDVQSRFAALIKSPKTERRAGMYSRTGGMGAYSGGSFKSGETSDDEGAEDLPTNIIFPGDGGETIGDKR